MFWKIAWRNIWAKKRQSVLTVALSVFCTVFLIFSFAFMNGQHEKMIQDAVEIYTGYLMITGKGHHDHPDYDHLIYDLDEVKKIADGRPEIENFSERFEAFALFAGDEDSVGGKLIGINPETEQYISRVKRAVTGGEYLDNTDQASCLIGKKLAKRLDVGLGDKLTYISQALDFSMAADILTIKGIFSTGAGIDADSVFIGKTYMDEIFLSQNMASQVVLLPKKEFRRVKLKRVLSQINEDLAASENEALDWETPLKSMLQMVNVDSAFGYFSYGILVVVIFFVIMIFSLISIFQRTKEIGVLRAVGTKPKQIILMLVGEAFILGTIAVVIGGMIGGWLSYYYYVHPIEFNVTEEILEQYQKWGVVDMVFPTVFSYADILTNCLFVLLLNIIAILYPAFKVTQYKPIDAINYV